jgi:cleavage stimulation factor subunit 2
VLSFRPVHDKETGKPKGFGFAEFADADAAASAVRNLNDFELHGRKLRVDYANEGGGKEDNAGHSTSMPMPDAPSTTQSAALPHLPPGRDLGPSLSAEDAISKTLNTLPPSQLLDILTQMQTLVNTEPARAQILLEQSPQLSYAIFQALLLLQLVDVGTLSSIIQQTTRPPVQQAPAYVPPPIPQTIAPPPQQFPPPGYPPQFPPHPGYSASNTPVGQPYQAPPQQPPQPPPQQQQQPDKAALVQQVLSMTQQQIDALPPMERGQIMALRAQLMQQYQR